jgi:hypothetical protein
MLRKPSNRRIQHLAMVATASDQSLLFVANAARRWNATQTIYPANPPSGDGGYRKRPISSLRSQRRQALECYANRLSVESTIWRWWLPKTTQLSSW